MQMLSFSVASKANQKTKFRDYHVSANRAAVASGAQAIIFSCLRQTISKSHAVVEQMA